jgi:hypothetical protein
MLEDSDLGFKHSEVWNLPFIFASWISGARLTAEIPAPITADLNPEFGTEFLDSYHEYIPIWSDRLVSAMRSAGVDNFELFDAVIRDTRTQIERSDYKAVNVIGCLDCVDMSLSKFDSRSERGAREFAKLVIDPAKVSGFKLFRLIERPTLLVIDSDVKAALEKFQIRGVRADELQASS